MPHSNDRSPSILADDHLDAVTGGGAEDLQQGDGVFDVEQTITRRDRTQLDSMLEGETCGI